MGSNKSHGDDEDDNADDDDYSGDSGQLFEKCF